MIIDLLIGDPAEFADQALIPSMGGATIVKMLISDKNPIVGYSTIWTLYNETGFEHTMMLVNGVATDPIVIAMLIARECAERGKRPRVGEEDRT